MIKKYLKIKNFLDESERKLLSTTAKVFLRSNKTYFQVGTDLKRNGANAQMYAMPVFEALMSEKHKLMEKKTKLTLFPTYSFLRMYTKYSILKEHTDRPSCEYSCTVYIDSCGTYKWPIYMGKTPIYLNPGDAVIYKGCEVPHSRKEFLGDWQAQCFLHYVDANGPNASFMLDRRRTLGEGK